jgi:hypothetical protein
MFSEKFLIWFLRAEEPGESDDDRPVLPRAVKSSASGIVDDENDNRKQHTTKKKRKRFDRKVHWKYI